MDQRLTQALRSLPEELRTALMLHVMADASPQVIAETLIISPSVAEERLTRATSLLKEDLADLSVTEERVLELLQRYAKGIPVDFDRILGNVMEAVHAAPAPNARSAGRPAIRWLPLTAVAALVVATVLAVLSFMADL